MKPIGVVASVPAWLDSETQALITDIIAVLSERHTDLLAIVLYGSVARHEERSLYDPDPSDVDLLAISDSEDPLLAISQGDSLSHTLGLAYSRHLDAPREVQVLFASRTLKEWDPTFIANVARDGITLFLNGTLPTPLRTRVSPA